MKTTVTKTIVCIIAFAVLGVSFAQTVVPHTFQAGQPARAADVNENFSSLETAVDNNAINLATNVTAIEKNALAIAALDDYVSLRVSGEFSDGSCCLIDPATGFIPRLDIGQFNGRDMLIEYVSCQVLIPPTQAVNLYIGENGQDAPVDLLIAIELSEQYKALASDSLFGTALHASQPVMVIVDSEDDLWLNGRRTVGSPGAGRASCVVAGRLVN